MKRYLIAAYFWVCSPLMTLGLYIFISLNQIKIRLLNEPQDGRPHHKIAILWGKTIISMIPGWSVTIEGVENIPADRDAVVIVANHESMADIWAMFFLNMQFRWLSKAEVGKIPVIGAVMRLCGYIFIKRGNRASAAAAMEQSKVVIGEGISMMFFPEGTRSVDGKLKDFKLGAFKLATETKADILPVAIHGAGVLFPKGSKVPFPSEIKIKVLPRVPAPDSNENLAGFASTVRDKIAEAHATLI
jgi:1-acyl-sn-glycerol-3-phosphate acyltransferase